MVSDVSRAFSGSSRINRPNHVYQIQNSRFNSVLCLEHFKHLRLSIHIYHIKSNSHSLGLVSKTLPVITNVHQRVTN